MFVALELTESPPNSIFGGLLNILTLPKVELELRQVEKARFIAACTCPTYRGINWREICRLCERYLDRMLIPEQLQPPEEIQIAAPPLPRFEAAVLISTACELIARTRMPMYRRILGLVDSTGEFAGQLEILLRHFTSVRVVTDNLDRYRAESERMMQELGAPVLVSEEMSSLSDCVLVLSPKTYHGRDDCRLPCPVLAGGVFVTQSPCDCITGLRVSPTESVVKACPQGIDPHLFTGALYEYCGAKDLPTVADNMLYNQKFTSLDETVKMILTHAGYCGILS